MTNITLWVCSNIWWDDLSWNLATLIDVYLLWMLTVISATSTPEGVAKFKVLRSFTIYSWPGSDQAVPDCIVKPVLHIEIFPNLYININYLLYIAKAKWLDMHTLDTTTWFPTQHTFYFLLFRLSRNVAFSAWLSDHGHNGLILICYGYKTQGNKYWGKHSTNYQEQQQEHKNDINNHLSKSSGPLHFYGACCNIFTSWFEN